MSVNIFFITLHLNIGYGTMKLSNEILSFPKRDEVFTHRNVWSMAELRTPCRNSNVADGASSPFGL